MTSSKGIKDRTVELCKAGLTYDEALLQLYEDLPQIKPRKTIDDNAQFADVEEYKENYRDTERLHVLTFGASRTILAEVSDNYHPWNKFYLVSEFGRNSGVPYRDAQSGKETVALINVTGGNMNGPLINLDTTTLCVYPSLEEFAEEEYRNAEFSTVEEAIRYYELLIRAGVDEDTLDNPNDMLHSSHPDSSEHVNYQLRSLEKEESRRPPR